MVASRRILIVGGAGFIGSHLARRCVAEGHIVHVIARPTSDMSRLSDLGSSVTRHRVLLPDAAVVRACLVEARPTHIFYLAGDTSARHDPSRSQALQSVGGLTDLLTLIDVAAQAAAPPRFFLRAGSIAEYGAEAIPFRETQRERPLTGYAAGLVAGTHYAQTLAPHLPFPLVTARLALIYGPGQADDFLVPSLISALGDGRSVVVERPLDRRDVLHVFDVVDALAALADADSPSGRTINIGSGTTIGVGELAETIATLMGADPSLIQRRAQSDPVTLLLDTRRLAEATGWASRISLNEGLDALIAATSPRTVAA
jgi:nucleoside-diphosphate-sugar epimerase